MSSFLRFELISIEDLVKYSKSEVVDNTRNVWLQNPYGRSMVIATNDPDPQEAAMLTPGPTGKIIIVEPKAVHAYINKMGPPQLQSVATNINEFTGGNDH